MEPIIEAERETLKLRLLAVAAVLATLYTQSSRAFADLTTTLLVAGLALLYVAYAFSLRGVLLPRYHGRQVVYLMILVDTAFLLAAVNLAGGLQSGTFLLFPILVILYSIYEDYSSSFFAAGAVSFSLAAYVYFTDPGGLNTGTILSLQVPLLFLLAYFSGFLARRAGEEKAKREALQASLRVERSVRGLRDVVRVLGRTLEVYENWANSAEQLLGPAKEAAGHQQFSEALDAQYAMAHFAFGKLYAENGLMLRAEEAFRRSLVLEPNLLDANRELSEVLMRQGRFEDALVAAKTYAEGVQQDWVGHQNLAVIYNELEMHDERRRAQEMALAVSTGEDREALASFFHRL